LKPTAADFKRQFAFAISLHLDEFSRDIEEAEEFVRFDFYRYLFLERNL